MTYREVNSLPELYVWIRVYCRHNLLALYEITIKKHIDSNGKVVYRIYDKVTARGLIET